MLMCVGFFFFPNRDCDLYCRQMRLWHHFVSFSDDLQLFLNQMKQVKKDGVSLVRMREHAFVLRWRRGKVQILQSWFGLFSLSFWIQDEILTTRMIFFVQR